MSLPIRHIALTKPRGAFKPCRWCKGALGRIEHAPSILPANHAGRVICEGCGRQTGWVSESQVRKALREVSPSAPADAVTSDSQASRLVTAPLSHSSEPTSSPVKTDKAGASGGSSAPAAYSEQPAHGPCEGIARKKLAIEPALVAPAGDTDPIVRYSTTPPAPIRKLRPNCLKPDNCAGYGSHTCHACTVAARESEVA